MKKNNGLFFVVAFSIAAILGCSAAESNRAAINDSTATDDNNTFVSEEGEPISEESTAIIVENESKADADKLEDHFGEYGNALLLYRPLYSSYAIPTRLDALSSLTLSKDVIELRLWGLTPGVLRDPVYTDYTSFNDEKLRYGIKKEFWDALSQDVKNDITTGDHLLYNVGSYILILKKDYLYIDCGTFGIYKMEKLKALPDEESLEETSNETTEYVSETERDYTYSLDIYDVSLRNANEEQKEKLLALKERTYQYYGRIREIKTIMGEIPEDAPRLTIEDAMRICNEYPVAIKDGGSNGLMGILPEKFNEIAGAPDEDAGSGIRHIFYSLDDEETEVIYVSYLDVIYHNYKNNTGMVIYDPYGGRPAGTIIEYPEPQTIPETEPAEDVYFAECLETATDDQKAKLLEISEDEYSRGFHVREIKTIMGELDENTPRLTKDKALEICNGLEVKHLVWGGDAEEIILEALNKYAGAPDIEGEIEIPIHIYYFDDTDHTKYITVMGFLLMYTDTEQEIEQYIWDYSNR